LVTATDTIVAAEATASNLSLQTKAAAELTKGTAPQSMAVPTAKLHLMLLVQLPPSAPSPPQLVLLLLVLLILLLMLLLMLMLRFGVPKPEVWCLWVYCPCCPPWHASTRGCHGALHHL
jgi:hypothetical protein